MFCNRNKGFEKRARSGSGNGPGTSETVFFRDRHFKLRFFEARSWLSPMAVQREVQRRPRVARDPRWNPR